MFGYRKGDDSTVRALPAEDPRHPSEAMVGGHRFDASQISNARS